MSRKVQVGTCAKGILGLIYSAKIQISICRHTKFVWRSALLYTQHLPLSDLSGMSTFRVAKSRCTQPMEERYASALATWWETRSRSESLTTPAPAVCRCLFKLPPSNLSITTWTLSSMVAMPQILMMCGCKMCVIKFASFCKSFSSASFLLPRTESRDVLIATSS